MSQFDDDPLAFSDRPPLPSSSNPRRQSKPAFSMMNFSNNMSFNHSIDEDSEVSFRPNSSRPTRDSLKQSMSQQQQQQFQQPQQQQSANVQTTTMISSNKNSSDSQQQMSWRNFEDSFSKEEPTGIPKQQQPNINQRNSLSAMMMSLSSSQQPHQSKRMSIFNPGSFGDLEANLNKPSSGGPEDQNPLWLLPDQAEDKSSSSIFFPIQKQQSTQMLQNPLLLMKQTPSSSMQGSQTEQQSDKQQPRMLTQSLTKSLTKLAQKQQTPPPPATVKKESTAENPEMAAYVKKELSPFEVKKLKQSLNSISNAEIEAAIKKLRMQTNITNPPLKSLGNPSVIQNNCIDEEVIVHNIRGLARELQAVGTFKQELATEHQERQQQLQEDDRQKEIRRTGNGVFEVLHNDARLKQEKLQQKTQEQTDYQQQLHNLKKHRAEEILRRKQSRIENAQRIKKHQEEIEYHESTRPLYSQRNQYTPTKQNGQQPQQHLPPPQLSASKSFHNHSHHSHSLSLNEQHFLSEFEQSPPPRETSSKAAAVAAAQQKNEEINAMRANGLQRKQSKQQLQDFLRRQQEKKDQLDRQIYEKQLQQNIQFYQKSTFQPKINSKSVQLVADSWLPIEERLHTIQESAYEKQKRKEAEEKSRFQHSPLINKKSVEIINAKSYYTGKPHNIFRQYNSPHKQTAHNSTSPNINIHNRSTSPASHSPNKLKTNLSNKNTPYQSTTSRNNLKEQKTTSIYSTRTSTKSPVPHNNQTNENSEPPKQLSLIKERSISSQYLSKGTNTMATPSFKQGSGQHASIHNTFASKHQTAKQETKSSSKSSFVEADNSQLSNNPKIRIPMNANNKFVLNLLV